MNKLRRTFLRQSEDRNRRKVGQYRIVKEIGKGGFAQVYEVEDANHRRYAMKEYDLDVALECFTNETAMGELFFKDGKLREDY